MSGKVLIIEDNALNMRLFVDLLKFKGIEAEGLTNGLNILEKLAEINPTVVITDVQLPEKTGYEIITEIRNSDAYSDIPIVAVTAFSLKGDSEKLLSAGATHFLAKPIQMQEFYDIILPYFKD
jgi:CheY-like chemotaxis protein